VIKPVKSAGLMYQSLWSIDSYPASVDITFVRLKIIFIWHWHCAKHFVNCFRISWAMV